MLQTRLSIALLPAFLSILAAPLGAQQFRERFPAADIEPTGLEAPGHSAFRPLRVAKWGSLAVALATAGVGLATHRNADKEYRALEKICAEDGARCRERRPDGAYADPELERRYQKVLDNDRAARLALLASQIGVAASVVFFILDLSPDGSPPNIPYEPQRFDVGARPDGALELRLRLLPGRT